VTEDKIAIMVLSTGMEMIGEVLSGTTKFGIDALVIYKPSVVSIQPTGLGLRSVFDGNPAYSGPDLAISRHAVVMISKPSKNLLDAYKAQRAGLLAAAPIGPKITGRNQ